MVKFSRHLLLVGFTEHQHFIAKNKVQQNSTELTLTVKEKKSFASSDPQSAELRKKSEYISPKGPRLTINRRLYFG